MEVGTALLSVTFEWLINKLESKTIDWFDSRKEARDALENWKKLLRSIRGVLKDAEMKQLTNDDVKTWLSELRDIAYDMEDILNGVEADEQRQELNLKTCDQASTSRARKVIPAPSCFTDCSCIPCDFKVDRETMSKIKGITNRLEFIKSWKDTLGLKIEHGTNRAVTTQRNFTTEVPESHVCGRKKDKEAILHMLLNDEDSTKSFFVIPIVGMGGLGKTTLARLVYNDEKLKGVFQKKAWVYVSDEFDVLGITKSILRQMNEEVSDSDDPGKLQRKLKELLTGQKFLLVLDDVWNRNYLLWERLDSLFTSGGHGSKIIVTTRDEIVGNIMGGDESRVCHLDLLPENECLSLLARHALETENFNSHGHLKGIGEEIVKQCGRLPLAVKTIAGLLREDRSNPDKWMQVLKSDLWKVSEEQGGILPALRLSYHHLPFQLKACFAYCAIFQKGSEFEEDDLVSLWMGQGLLRQQQVEGVKQMKSLGHQYFLDLLSRSFFQQSSNNLSCFVMHDHMVDLARYVALETCYHLSMSDGRIPEVTRHLSFFRGDCDTYERFKVMDKMKSLRTFLPLSPAGSYGWSYLSNRVVHDLFSKMRCLRVLSFSGYKITKVPDSIGDLKLLCYINLSRTQIQVLPDTVSFLVYLQTLILCYCDQLTQLPEGIVNLADLLHLDITGTRRLKKLPSGMGRLINLLTLPKFITGKDGGLRLRELKNLKHLQGKLLILDLHNVSNFQDASEANLYEIEGLDELVLQWTDDFQTSRNVSNEDEVLSQLKPHCHLKRFTIKFFGGQKFPSWIGDSSFSKLEYLELRGCQNITSLPSLGQLPLLKELIIKGMLEFHGDNSFSGSFSSLEELTLEDCPKLIGKLPSHLPSLQSLVIRKCPQLSYSPLSLPSLRELEIKDCNEGILRSMVNVTCLTSLKIERIPKLACLPKSIIQSLTALEIKECDELTCLWEDGASMVSLKCLRIQKCPLLVSFPDLLPSSLEILDLEGCDNLDCLPNGLHALTCLEELSIRKCKKFVHFPITGLPLYLKKLKLEDLVVLESLPDGLMKIGDGGNNMLQLEELVINRCDHLKSFPRGKLPSTLKRLEIINCENVEFLPEGVNLEHLVICLLPSLKCLPSSKLPSALKSLDICDCEQLESLPDRLLQDCTQLKEMQIESVENLRSLPIDFMHSLSSLVELVLTSCEGLASLPKMGPSSVPSLKTLKIWGWTNLKSLPDEMWNLRSLRWLVIWNCSGIASIPEGGFPLNLETFAIGCKGMRQSMLEWGLDRLTSLKLFEIGWICPPDNLLLPKSLRSLIVRHVDNLKSIPKGLFQDLSLVDLHFRDCPKLRSLPKKGLPTSLQQFWLCDCPLLKKRCLEEKGDYWPFIANIPRVVLLD
ncbi:hypothetical protein SLA2020_211520 [Shorea laevis]